MSTAALTKWGNSIGIRIPSAIVKSAHLTSGVEMDITVNQRGIITLTPRQNTQEGWTEKFNAIADAKEDELLINLANEFDDEEWEW
ncbi:MAG: AbrB/MazE/SpoVT family DNA-binding domain-containing protein [Gammaproteobacteria bacterium]|nr:AbrB/MazE/SpoVT family DNA-binding domain-containing protein [Gammaproteobacteria bacterium]